MINLLVGVLLHQAKFGEIEASSGEWLRNLRALLPSGDLALADLLAQISYALPPDGGFAEVENLARECLTIREQKLPNDWRTYEIRSTLGCCLSRQKRYAEAEPSLVSGCEGLRQHASEIPRGWKPRASGDLGCLVQLYNATDRAVLASEWMKKRQEFDQPAGP